MKIIHTADQHLDSEMNSHLPKEKVRERKAEILKTFSSMVDYAKEEKADAILLCGDLFDSKSVSAKVEKTVYSLIKNHPDIQFFYLRGNHDTRAFLSIMEDMPDNFKSFNDNCWKSYKLSENVIISGIELTKANQGNIYNGLELDESKINICMLHGQISQGDSKDFININRLRNKNIDYLALGHIHSVKKGDIDSRGIWCYSGCLEGRGFDEPGEKGFVILDIDENSGRIEDSFAVICSRKIDYLEVDISSAKSDSDAKTIISDAISKNNIPQKDIVDIRLVGSLDEDIEIDDNYLLKCFEADFYYVRIKNKTNIKIDYNKYLNDQSLKAEFLRTVMSDDKLTKDEKDEIISCGFKALRREDLTHYICN